jgi:inner membrane protein
MASIISHVAVPISFRLGLGRELISVRLLRLAAFLSMVPDADVIAFKFGIPYESQWGHRGFSHSILFALIVSALFIFFSKQLRAKPATVYLICFFSMISHGLLDAMTNGGLGVAVLWPFDNERYFLPWNNIEVSPIGASAFLSQRGLEVLYSELFYVWLPCGILALLLFLVRHQMQKLRKPLH